MSVAAFVAFVNQKLGIMLDKSNDHMRIETTNDVENKSGDYVEKQCDCVEYAMFNPFIGTVNNTMVSSSAIDQHRLTTTSNTYGKLYFLNCFSLHAV